MNINWDFNVKSFREGLFHTCIDYHHFLLNPFDEKPVRMTDAIYAMDGCNLFPSAVRSLSRQASLYLPSFAHLSYSNSLRRYFKLGFVLVCVRVCDLYYFSL